MKLFKERKIDGKFLNGEEVEDLVSYVSEQYMKLFTERKIEGKFSDHIYMLQAWTSWKEGTAPNLVDPTLRNGLKSEIMRCIHIGLLCVQENIVDRPTMTAISVMLNSYSLALPLPSPPNLFMTSRTDPLALDCSTTTVTESDQSIRRSSLNNASVNEDITQLFPR